MSSTGFLGSTIRQSYRFPTQSQSYTGEDLSPVDYVVGSTVEFTSNDYQFSVDLTDTSILITHGRTGGWNPNVDFNGPAFSDTLDNVPDIIGI